MSIIGKWKYSEMAVMDGDTPGWMQIDEYVKKNPDPMFEMMQHEVIEFTPDFKMITTIEKSALPAEFLEEIPETEGDTVVLEEVAWKEEDGKYYMHDDNPGTICDEPAPEWIELPIEDGKIELLAMSKLSRC